MRFLRDLKRELHRFAGKVRCNEAPKDHGRACRLHIVRLSTPVSSKAEPFKMNIVEHEEDLHAAGGGAPGR